MHPRRRQSNPSLMTAALVATAVLAAAACGGDEGSEGSEGPGGTTSTTAAGQETGSELGTTSGPPDGTDPQPGGSLVFAVEAEPEGLDPTRYAFSSSGHFVASAVIETLATLDAEGRAVPYLADSIDHDDAFTTWTITVPSGVTFHDGTDLTAQVVAQNLEAHRNSYITKAGLVSVESIEATSDTEVVVRLAKPFAAFDAALASQFGYVVAPAMLEDPARSLAPIGTGPFVFDDHVANESWTFTRNPDYRRGDRPYLERIEFRPIVDNTARQTELERGNVDVMITRVPEVITALRESEFKQVENLSGEEDFLVLNTQAPPFDDLLARQAIVTGTDSGAWLDEVGGGIVQPANSLFAPGQPGYLADNGYPAYDLDRARELVEQYEAETGEPLAFTLKTQADTEILVESQLFERLWEEAGMEVTVEAIPQINLIAQIATASFEVGRFRLFGQPNVDVDANTFLRSTSVLPPPDISLNFPRFQSEVVDEAIDAAVASTDQTIRDQQYQQVNRELASQLPYVWLGRPVWMLAADPRVNGVYAGANGTVQTIGSKTWLADLWLSS